MSQPQAHLLLNIPAQLARDTALRIEPEFSLRVMDSAFMFGKRGTGACRPGFASRFTTLNIVDRPWVSPFTEQWAGFIPPVRPNV